MAVSKLVIYDLTSKEYRTVNGTIIFKTIENKEDRVINTHFKVCYVYNIIDDKIVYSYNHDWERKACESFQKDLDDYVRSNWRANLMEG